jgi:gliding motility-associated-like protein
MKTKKFLVLTLVLLFGSFNKIAAQLQNSIAIVLNEYCVTNLGGIADNYGDNVDWVEISNNHTSSVTLGGYYLSNDRNNLTKWQFPSTFTLGVGQVGVVYLSGRNENKQVAGTWYYHSNFNIDQCKNQWLILSTPPPLAIRDSVFIQRTQAGHSRGRVDASILGVQGWRIYTTPSFAVPNPSVNFYIDYLPTPSFTPQAGWGHNGQTVDMFLYGSTIPYSGADTSNCFEIHYTTNGCIPTYSDPVYTNTDTPCPQGGGPLFITDNMMVRAITLPKLKTGSCADCTYICPQSYLSQYLPSFVQTNSYLSESSGNFDGFDGRFGLLSLGVSCADTSWFNTTGSNEPVVHAEYFDCNQKGAKELFEAYASIARPTHESWLTKQRGFYITIDDRRGWGCNFEYQIFDNSTLGASSRTVFPTLHVYAGDHESLSLKNNAAPGSPANGTGIRDVFLQSLSTKYNIDVNPLHIKPLIVFINGKYAGAYNFKEVYDKYYEAFYKHQNKDSLFLQYYEYGDSFVCHYPGQAPCSNPQRIGVADNIFRTEVYDWCTTKPMNSPAFYNTLMSRLDKSSFIDWNILGSYAMNSGWYNADIAFAKGFSKLNNGDRWHYYLWNAPATFNYIATQTNTLVIPSPYYTPCFVQTGGASVSAFGGNGQGNMLKRLMDANLGNPSFQLEYKNRYQDLLNTALKCDNILAHYDAVVSLYRKEMKYMEDPSNSPSSMYTSQMDNFDTNTARLRRNIVLRCQYMKSVFTSTIPNCYAAKGQYEISVNVYPDGAGMVKLNSIWLDSYPWTGLYFPTQLAFKAVPTSTNYVFHHWELKNHIAKNNAPLSLDSIAIDYNQPEEVLAVFTDITNDIDMPTGFSPNGDGNNDTFKPQGSALYSHEYEMRIYSRWGQEVFRSTDPTVGWDGYYENKQSQTGVYAYVITYKNVFNEAKIKKGNVTLIR